MKLEGKSIVMNADYPPLPRPAALQAHIESPSVCNKTNASPASPSVGNGYIASSGQESPTTVISVDGDVIIEYVDRDDSSPLSSTSTVSYRWQVTSGLLVRNSPYFRALLDPKKFSEGRLFMEQKQAWNSNVALDSPGTALDDGPAAPMQHVLPTVQIPGGRLIRVCGVDAIELFLRILCLDSLTEDTRPPFEHELKFQPPSLISRLIEVADELNSPNVVQDILRRIGYSFGKSKTSLFKFSSSLLKMNEDRIRQIIFVSAFLKEYTILQVMTHVLLVVGSRFWINGPEAPPPESLRWRYLPSGVEEEMYCRRQCVMNTITDLQAYFLRVYGALEDPDDSKSISTNTSLGSASSPSIQMRHFQCRGGFGNSSACDLFHLGQMTRFFSLRTKTVFLGSTLIDPDFSLDVDDGDYDHHSNDRNRSVAAPSLPPSDITAIIASLKQYPDYQIDSNHLGCGVRRRLLPALDCIEKFVWDSRGLLGIDLRLWDRSSPHTSTSWENSTARKDHTVDVRFAKITAVYYPAPDNPGPRSTSLEDDARLFFTAKKRNWEA